MPQREGIVVRSQGGHYYVRSGCDPEVDCAVRGRLKKTHLRSDLIAPGDRVLWVLISPAFGMIEEVLPRKSALSRQASRFRPGVEQVVVANIDQVLLVFAVGTPALDLLMLDRYLVGCEAVKLPALIVMNKADLFEEGTGHDPLALYRQIGYRIYYVSAATHEGLEPLREALTNKISALTGPSGVGKSSLLNALWPEWNLPIGELSTAHPQGRHTTAVAQLLSPAPGTYVADTPGMRQFYLWDIDPEQLEAFFPEMLPFLNGCHYTPCTHIHEPGCAIREAVARGAIAASRYASYTRMFATRL